MLRGEDGQLFQGIKSRELYSGGARLTYNAQSEDAVVDGVLVRGARSVFTLDPSAGKLIEYVESEYANKPLEFDPLLVEFDELEESGKLYEMRFYASPIDHQLFLQPMPTADPSTDEGKTRLLSAFTKYFFVAGADPITITGSISPRAVPGSEVSLPPVIESAFPVNKVTFPFIKIEIELAGAFRGLAHVQRFNGYGYQIPNRANGSKRLNFRESFTSVQAAWGKEKTVVTLETGAEVLITSPVGGNAGGKPAALPYPDLMVRAFDDDGEPVAIGRFTTEADGRTRLPEGGWLYFANSPSGPLGAGGTAGVKKIELTGDPALPYNPRFSRNYSPGDPPERLYSYTVTAVRVRTTEITEPAA